MVHANRSRMAAFGALLVSCLASACGTSESSTSSFKGNLGGIVGADQKCQNFALAAGLKGTFQAWLSDSKTDAIDRVPVGGPWKKLRDGVPAELVFASRDSWKGFPDPDHGDLFQDERGLAPGGGTPETWTGTGRSTRTRRAPR